MAKCVFGRYSHPDFLPKKGHKEEDKASKKKRDKKRSEKKSRGIPHIHECIFPCFLGEKGKEKRQNIGNDS